MAKIDDSVKKKVPELRFKGFTDPWVQRKLTDISEKVTEKNSDNEFSETLTNSAEYGIISQRDFFDKDISNEKNLNTYYVVRDGDFVYNPRISSFAPVGPIKRNTLGRTGVMSPLYYIFRAHNVDGMYLEKYFSSTKWHRFMELNGDTGARADRFAIKDKDFVQMPIPLPNLEEQSKIARFLENVDNLIAANQRKLDLLKEQKKGYLQKMFPKNGAKVPELRFAGFADDWEDRKLGELMEITSVKRIHQSDWTNNGIRFLRARDIVSASKGEEPSDYLYISEEKYEEYSKVSGKVQIGDLLVTGVGTIGVPMLVIHNDPLYFKDGNIIWFKNQSIMDGNFFYYSFIGMKIQKYIRDVAGIGTVGTYTIDSGKKTPISLPNIEEQQKIGSFFKQLDNTIALHQRKLDLLKEQKKGFLQKMFV